jgi:general stress protein YciG
MPKRKGKSRRGLASADEQTRKRVASMGGLSHDVAFFSEIGRKGGRSSR